jgi:hypothetical protein
MASNATGMVPRTETAGNGSAEMEHLKSSIDDVFVISNGIIVCCE